MEHREVQGFESRLFLSYFNGSLTVMEGGIESGFRRVTQQKKATLHWVKGGRTNVRVIEVPTVRDSLNSGVSFSYNFLFA